MACVALAFTFLTHDPVADGPRRQFALALLQLVMGSCVLGFVVLRHLEKSMKAALLAGSSLMLVGAGIHAARLAHPLTRGIADTNLTWRATSTLPGPWHDQPRSECVRHGPARRWDRSYSDHTQRGAKCMAMVGTPGS
ncbi:MAG: hypothetical protein EBT00_16795 [Proteobacteria bacterium]|nr:hypothetical protein [Pseudomonadota bacterium]